VGRDLLGCLCSSLILAGEACEDGSSVDAGGVQVDDLCDRVVRVVVGDVLVDSLVRACRVVVGGVFGQDCA
jgi:hypothetical protein